MILIYFDFLYIDLHTEHIFTNSWKEVLFLRFCFPQENKRKPCITIFMMASFFAQVCFLFQVYCVVLL